MRKKLYCFILFLVVGISSYSQTNSELLRMADESFKVQNYMASSSLYKQIIINIDSGVTEASYPYGVVPYPAPPKKHKKGTDTTSTDSTASKTNVAKTDTSTSKEVKINIDPLKLYCMEQLALSYKLLHSYGNAEIWYKQLYDLSAPKYYYDYGKVMIMNGKFKPVIDMTNNIILDQEVGTDEFKKSRELIKNANYAKQTSENKNKVLNYKSLDTIVNTSGGAFAASFAEEEGSIIFSSSRNSRSNKGNFQAANSDIYKVSLDNSATPVDVAHSVSQFINSDDNEGSAVFSPDKTKIYFTRWNYDAQNLECAIYVSKFLNGQWLTPRKLRDNINFPGSRTMHPSLSPDGSTLYFSSDRPGGEGKLDIWYCAINEVDNAEEIKNAGKVVNTAGNEVTPFVHPNNFLFFSSDGQLGMGGLDVFKVSMERGFIPPAKNMGSPINSNRDDAYYTSDANGQVGFFSSDRKPCDECGDIHCYKIYYFEDKPILITISGKVYDEKTKEPVVNSMISFIDVSESYEPIFVFTDEKGEYKTKLNKDVDYFATAQKKGFFKDAVSISTMNINKSTDMIQDFNFALREIPAGDIVIQGIEYDLNSANLRPISKIKLDSLIDFLDLNDNLIVEINSHTDVRGSDEYNMKLSEARAQSVVNYLVESGIEKERLVAKGKGETEPLIVDAKTEEEHQKNRRTAFRMLSQDFQPVDKYKYIRRQSKTVEEQPKLKAIPLQQVVPEAAPTPPAQPQN